MVGIYLLLCNLTDADPQQCEFKILRAVEPWGWGQPWPQEFSFPWWTSLKNSLVLNHPTPLWKLNTHQIFECRSTQAGNFWKRWGLQSKCELSELWGKRKKTNMGDLNSKLTANNMKEDRSISQNFPQKLQQPKTQKIKWHNI